MEKTHTDRCDVTAIVSTYNSERFIRGCLENLEAQSIADRLEIIVIDSNSGEDERSIVEEFRKRYGNILYIRTDEREELYAAWNRGIQLANGRYIVNANTDDRLLPRSLEIKASALDMYTDVGLVYADVWSTEVENDTFDPGNTDRFHLYRYPDFTPLSGLTGSNFSPQPMWRKSAHDMLGFFDESYTVAGDYEFFYRLAVKLGALHIREPLGLYLENQSGIEYSHRELTKSEFSRLRNKFYDSIPLEVFFPLLSDFPDDRLAKGCVFWELGNNCMFATLKRESDRAASYYEQASDMLGQIPALMHNLAVAYIDSGNLDEGTAILKKVGQNSMKSLALLQNLECSGGSLADTKMHLNQPNHPVVKNAGKGRNIDAGVLLTARSEAELRKTPDVAKASILIMVSDSRRYLMQCIDRIAANVFEPYEIIFLVDSTQKDDRHFLEKTVRENKNSRLIWCEKGLSFNSGIKAATGDPIVIMHDDVIVSNGWLEDMKRSLTSDPLTGVVGPMTNAVAGIQKDFRADYGDMDRFDDHAKKFRDANMYRRTPVRIVSDVCIMFRRALAERIGLFDETFETPCLMVEDFCIRLRLEGFKNIIASDVFAHYCDLHPSGQGNADKDRKAFDGKWSGIDVDSLTGKKLYVMNLLDAADELNQKGKIDDAVKMLIDGIGQCPTEKRIYQALSQVLINAGRFKEAHEVLETIPGAKETDADGGEVCATAGVPDIHGLMLAGYCLEGMNRYDEAGVYADRVLALDEVYAPALNLKGMLAYRERDNSSAERFFHKAIESDHGYGEPYTNLGVLKLDDEHSREAMEFLEKGFVLCPRVNEIAETFHSAVTASGEFLKAENRFVDAVALNHHNRNIRYLLIDLFLQQSKYELALNEIEKLMIFFGMDDGLVSAALEIRGKIGPMEILPDTENRQTLSLCMIVKDEEKYLPRCLGSIKPVVDEMIIVDTGSIDRTKDIAKLFGAKVYDFEWNDDFSEARNFSLSKAAGEWIFVLDADEVVSPIDYGELKDLITRAEKFPVAYSITTRNYVRPINVLKWVANDGKYREEEAGTGWYPSPKIRLFNNDPRMRFQGRVHEVIEPSLKKTGISPTPCSVPVHHYGKLIDARNISKGEEYYLLGKKKIEERGGDFKSLIELATQAGELKRHDEAVELWQQVIGLKSDMPVAYLNMSTAYMEIGDYAAGLEASKNALNLDPELKEAALNYSTCAMCAGEPKRAILTLEGLLQQAPEHPVAMALLSGGYCLERDKEKAFEMMNRIKNMGFECGNYLADLSERLISSKRIDSAILLLEAAVENGNSTREIRSLLSELKG